MKTLARIQLAALLVLVNGSVALLPTSACAFGQCENYGDCVDGESCGTLTHEEREQWCLDRFEGGLCKMCEALCLNVTTCPKGTAYITCRIGAPWNPCP